MPLITIEAARRQVNLLETETFQDQYLQQLMAAVEAHIRRRLNCTFFETAAEYEAADPKPPKAIIIEESQDLTHAGLLLLAHWFTNREAVSTVQMVEVPAAFESLIFEFRDLAIG
ncbi:head-tail connector protein [Shewanella xiamenensis]|uniref:head-tail connector protein n=1 Tax=Shewanella xiamenensis TaxID=332186 RepID=UPI00313E8884